MYSGVCDVDNTMVDVDKSYCSATWMYGGMYHVDYIPVGVCKTSLLPQYTGVYIMSPIFL